MEEIAIEEACHSAFGTAIDGEPHELVEWEDGARADPARARTRADYPTTRQRVHPENYRPRRGTPLHRLAPDTRHPARRTTNRSQPAATSHKLDCNTSAHPSGRVAIKFVTCKRIEPPIPLLGIGGYGGRDVESTRSSQAPRGFPRPSRCTTRGHCPRQGAHVPRGSTSRRTQTEPFALDR